MAGAAPAPSSARQAAELAARSSYGRLVALVAARSGDIAAAEDALADAFLAALRRWPETGVPDRPEAWLLTAARNGAAKVHRHAGVRSAAAAELARIEDERQSGTEPFPDQRLKLLFVCAHPAIHPDVRAPLMLQTVLAVDAARIAAAYLCPPATMSQRLVRAKAKIRDARLRFQVPEPGDMAERLPDVLDAIYGAYGLGWDDLAGAGGADLSAEALFLGRLAVHLLPDAPEAKGLLALMLYCEARRPARRAPDGAFVPLERQDATLWSRPLIIEAEDLLTAAAAAGTFGRFQCEAAIQSLHIQRPITGRLNHQALMLLHDLLVERAPSLGALVSRAALQLELGDPSGALAALDALPQDRVQSYQPYWVVRRRALAAAGRPGADAALARALELTLDPGVRAFLSREGRAGPDA